MLIIEFALIRGWTLVLYGTVITPQKDDEPRQSSASPSLLYNNNNNYSLNTFYRTSMNNYGTTNLNTNRSQQPQHKSTTVPAQAAARKNGKQKTNGKGNKNYQRTSTTPKPAYTTVMLNQYSTNGRTLKNKSKVSQSANRVTPTFRPRTTTNRPSTTKSQLNFGSGIKNNNDNLLVPSLQKEKSEAAGSKFLEKSSGKAPKQVKETSYTTPSIHDSRATPSLSMSQMFERYEKIEQIYPELKPYKDNNNPAYFTVTNNGNGNGKPSRENSKSFSSLQSSTPQKKNSPSDNISNVVRQQVIPPPANEMIGRGTN